MFYLGWIAVTVAGILVSIAVFIWALRTGQFSDQGRARYLPLGDDYPMEPAVNESRRRPEAYALLLVMASGLLAMACAVLLTMIRVYG